MSTNGKDVIYIDIDDEITSIIDKILSAKERIVAVVLPKRAAMLQSTVNMKLLKKAATDAKKQIVLITTETGLLPLAGAVGLHVAKNLESKPAIPIVDSPQESELDELLSVEDGKASDEDFDAKSSAQMPVGDLADMPKDPDAASASKKAKPELTPRPIPRSHQPDDTIELDNAAAAAIPEASKEKQAKNKKLKVPDFNKFRLRLILGVVLLVILIVGWILADIILPKATIDISTKTSDVNSNLTLNLNTTSSTVNPTSLTLPALLQQTQKTASQQVPTTGQKNEGTPATGQVTLTNCSESGSAITIPAGTGLSTSAGLTFVTQSAASLSTSAFDSHGNCKPINGISSTTLSVTAQNPGSAYNIPASSFTVSGFSDVEANSSQAMSGGTDNIVQIVSQTDINNAQQKISLPSNDTIKSALESSLQQAGWYAIPATFNAGSPSTSTSASVGAQASTVTITETATYTMFGVHQNDLQTVVNNNVNGQINTSKQAIQNSGVNQASFTLLTQSNTTAQLTMLSSSIVGPNLSVASLKNQVAGKKAGDVQSIIGSDPGVTSVSVHFSPFWVSSTPNNVNKIVIVFKKSSG